MALASEIVEQLGARVVSTREIVGEGEVNFVFVCETSDGKWVVRFHRDPLDTDDYATEEWCLRTMKAHGILVPKFVARGQIGGVWFIVQAFVPGVSGSLRQSKEMWGTLGRYARTINEIALDKDAPDSLFPRFGRDLIGNWKQHIAYNLGELHANDPLLDLGVYRLEVQQLLRECFEELGSKVDRFGLIHGDLVPKNTLVADDGQVTIIDWGSASTGPVPFHDYNRIQQCGPEEAFSPVDLANFAHGYGVPLQAVQDTMSGLHLLGSIDVIRWAIDRRPDRIATYADRARKVVNDCLPIHTS